MTTKALQYFVNKPCSVFVEPTARQLNEKQAISYFLGVIESIDDSGVMMRHPATGCKNFFFRNYVVGICEEEILDPANPNDAKAIEQYKQKADKVAQPPAPPPPQEDVHQTEVNDSPFVDINAITELAKRAKKSLK